jgi:hypothetical protein
VQRVLLMVHELHKQGYQRIRICPGMAPSGMHWRCAVTHSGNILTTDGAMCRDYDVDTALYSSASGQEYFGWEDARQDTARQLAGKFIERFPKICRKGKGRDWAYAGWYVEMLGLADRGAFPVAYADWQDKPDPAWLPTTDGFQSGLPMPPGGEADEGA